MRAFFKSKKIGVSSHSEAAVFPCQNTACLDNAAGNRIVPAKGIFRLSMEYSNTRCFFQAAATKKSLYAQVHVVDSRTVTCL